MPYPSPFRSSLTVVATFVGLAVLLSCQNDVTAPQTSTKVVSGHWNTEILRMPDSAAWALHDTTGTFALTTFAADTSFTVQAILPRVMAPKDTLVLSLFTLSLRTTLAFCKADGSGNLTLWDTSTHDAKAAHLLQVLDSARKKSPAVWGSKTDSVEAQVRSLQKLYATLILSGDGILKGFPAVHPVGIDSVAVVDQILILASAQKLTLHGLDSLVSSLAALDSANVRKEARKLGQAKKLDTLALFPAPVVIANQAPIFAGATDISKTLDTTAQSVSNWITAISAGPKNEASQSVRFEVVADSGASLFSVLPTVDSSGTLRYQAKSAGKGVFRVRAQDNGGTTNGGVDTSAWVSFSIQLSTKAVLTISGIPSTLQMAEDSLLHIPVTLYGADSATLRLVSGDTTLLGSQIRTVHRTDSLALQAKPDANGGPVQIVFLLQGNGLADTVDAVVTVVARNDPPTFAGATDISKTLDASAQVVPNWITAISVGPKNEASQSVRFEVVADSGASLFSVLPTVDSSGTLRYQAKSAGKGVFRVRAHDNGDSIGPNVNVSAWKSFAIQLFSRPVLIATGPTDTVRLVEDSATTISFSVLNFVGSSLSLKFAPVDTSLISSHSWMLVPDANGKVSITLQGKSYAYGGPITTIATLSDSLDAANLIVPVTIAARNHPPSFGGAPNVVVTASATTKSFPGWVDSISAGPYNEVSQKVSFLVQVVDGASLFATAPSVDANGALSFAGKSTSSGLAHIQVRAMDDDSVDPGNRSSVWKTASIYFNQAPTLALPTQALSTWENQIAPVGTAVVYDLETSSAHLSLSWTVSDSTILPNDSVYVSSSGNANRNLALHPAVHRWGTVKVVFTVTDSLGATAVDSLVLTVQPLNRAPKLSLNVPAFLYSYKAAATLGSISWDSISTTQTGRLEVLWQNLSDTQYLSLAVSGNGVVTATSKLDTAVSVSLKIRGHDSAGSAAGGVDTSAWSSLTLRIADTAMDAQGNAYRVRRMPDGKVWMRENLRTQAPYGPNAWANGVQRNGMSYSWAQALAKDSTCSASTCPVSGQQRGICPSGWHLSDSVSWAQLVRVVAGSDPDSVGFRKLRADSGWLIGGSNGATLFEGTNDFGMGIYQTSIWSYSWEQTPRGGGGESSYGTTFCTKDGLLNFLNSVRIGRDTTIVGSNVSEKYTNPTAAPVRCVLDQ